ncbi:MAG: hypothetical protein M0D55_09355 [Elusimicrobiota bacterium]|nr:MAG: hypothetical protein M0D55_09355 [Elusimicrobiota bacterium]
MADNNDPSIPDLRKAAEARPPAAPPQPVAKSAASAPILSAATIGIGRQPEKEQSRFGTGAKVAAVAGLMLVGGEFSGSAPCERAASA